MPIGNSTILKCSYSRISSIAFACVLSLPMLTKTIPIKALGMTGQSMISIFLTCHFSHYLWHNFYFLIFKLKTINILLFSASAK